MACQHWEAAEAGAAVLRRGGNAMDAAVTTAVALSVVEPWLSGLGGGGFLLHAGPDGAIEALDFNVRAPGAADPADYPLAEGTGGDLFDWPSVEGDRNIEGPLSICVPGAVAGLSAALERHGTIAWADALAPAAELAERGLHVDWFAELAVASERAALERQGTTFVLDASRRRPHPEDPTAQLLPMPRKAALLRDLAERGARDFYAGRTAAALRADLAAVGSRISGADLAGYAPRWVEPAAAPYRDRVVHTMPGLSGGPTLLDALGRLEGQDLAGMDEPEAAAAQAVAVRAAYEARLEAMGHAGRGGECTTHVSAIDGEGAMVSLTNTILSRFGSKVVAPSLGLLLNNGMMWFDPRPGRPNSVAGGARPLANMAPVIATLDGRPDIAVGAAGGRRIFPAILSLLSAMIDRGLSPEDAFHAPRIDASTSSILVDRRAAPGTAEAVARHHPIQITDETVHPVQFAIPSMVRAGRDGPNVGMVHPPSPWSAVAVA